MDFWVSFCVEVAKIENRSAKVEAKLSHGKCKQFVFPLTGLIKKIDEE